MKVAAIIPCRYGAVRFPGKSLADINGKPMLWRVHQRALKATSLALRYKIRTCIDIKGL